MKISKKVLSLVLALALVVGTFASTTAFAETFNDSEQPSDSCSVHNSADLAAALKNDAVNTIYLESDVEVNQPIEITRGINLDGQGHAITLTGGTGSTSDDSPENVIHISSSEVNVSDVTIAGKLDDTTNIYSAIYVYKQNTLLADISLENITVRNFGNKSAGHTYGIYVNGNSKVSLSGEICFDETDDSKGYTGVYVRPLVGGKGENTYLAVAEDANLSVQRDVISTTTIPDPPIVVQLRADSEDGAEADQYVSFADSEDWTKEFVPAISTRKVGFAQYGIFCVLRRTVGDTYTLPAKFQFSTAISADLTWGIENLNDNNNESEAALNDVANGQQFSAGDQDGYAILTGTASYKDQEITSASIAIEISHDKYVATLNDLKAALENTDVDTIYLTADIENIPSSVIVDRKVTINGWGHWLKFKGLENATDGVDDGLIVEAADTEITCLNVDAGLENPNSWVGTYAIHVYNTTGVTLESVIATGGNGGILVNGSGVTLQSDDSGDSVQLFGNGFGGVEVSKGTGLETQSVLTIADQTGFINDTEAYGQPTIWLVNGQGSIVNNSSVKLTSSTDVVEGQTQYYLDDTHAVAPTDADVSDIDMLRAALANEDIKTINITDDISDIDSTLIADHAVTINGKHHKLTFTNALNTLDNGERQGLLVEANDVTINDLTVQMAGDDDGQWTGVYGIQVYNAKGVTLKGVAASGADGGILVNASEVKLQGTIKIGGNEFGGIEVSRGEGEGLSNSTLTVTGVLVNDTEAYGQPTIWLVKGQGTVTGAFVPKKTIEKQINESTTQTQYYTDAANAVEPAAGVANVATIEALTEALSNQDITTINITRNISRITAALVADHAVTINGGGHKLTFTSDLNTQENGQRQGVLVEANNVTINNLAVQMAGAVTWQGVYGIQVYNATGVTLNDVTVSGADGGILVNGSAVTLTGATTVGGNEFGGIEVSKGEGLSTPSEITVNGTLVNVSEVHGQPTIWVVGSQGSIADDPSVVLTSKTDIVGGQTQYYLVAANAVEPTNSVANVSTIQTLTAALLNPDIETINITADISDINAALIVNHAVTIEGKGRTLSFTDALNGLANGLRQGILIEASGVTINDLTVQMTGDVEWQGVYGIQVYNVTGTGVTLNNVAASGADGGILVNSSKVTLTGTTTVSDNEFGGIEVSKGEGLSTLSALTVSGILVNDTEAYGQPTIWLVKGQGTVTGTHVLATNKTLKFDQIQYYIDTDHAAESTPEDAQTAINDVKDLEPDNLTDGDKSNIKDAVQAVLGLSDDAKQALSTDDIGKLDELLAAVAENVNTEVAAPETSAIQNSSDKLTVKPIVSGLLLAAGITGSETTTVSLSTTQVAPTGSGSLLALELNLVVGSNTIHDLAVPVTVTIQLPSSFVYNPSSKDYKIQHVHDGISEDLPLTISGSSGAYTGTFTTSSFSTFTVVGTNKPTSSNPSSGSNPGTVVTTPTTFVSDTTADFNVNGVYQFKITSTNGQVPSLVVGTAGVFNTQLVKTEGNDYYFRLTAVGAPGAKAGIYVNGVRLLVATVASAASTAKCDTTRPFNVKAGEAYTFKITADAKPTFGAGTTSAFRAEFVKAIGKDYFFKVTAVGKAGAASGFYINNKKAPVTVATIIK